jgi:hypothetical protein
MYTLRHNADQYVHVSAFVTPALWARWIARQDDARSTSSVADDVTHDHNF